MSPQTSRRTGGCCPNPCVQNPKVSHHAQGSSMGVPGSAPTPAGTHPNQVTLFGFCVLILGTRSLHSGRVGGSISGLAWSSNATSSFLLKHISPSEGPLCGPGLASSQQTFPHPGTLNHPGLSCPSPLKPRVGTTHPAHTREPASRHYMFCTL